MYNPYNGYGGHGYGRSPMGGRGGYGGWRPQYQQPQAPYQQPQETVAAQPTQMPETGGTNVVTIPQPAVQQPAAQPSMPQPGYGGGYGGGYRGRPRGFGYGGNYGYGGGPARYGYTPPPMASAPIAPRGDMAGDGSGGNASGGAIAPVKPAVPAPTPTPQGMSGGNMWRGPLQGEGGMGKRMLPKMPIKPSYDQPVLYAKPQEQNMDTNTPADDRYRQPAQNPVAY